MLRVCWIAVTFAACLAPARAGEAPRPAGPTPIGTRQNVFAIPFRVDASGGKQALEVQLHVSDDEGASWHLVGKVAPSVGRFKFTAPHDGQYWFMVRTLDQQGVLRPAGPPLPELKVIVDTVPPVLELKAQRGNAGEVRAQWRIRDTFLRPESLRISYRSNSGNEAWQPVATDPLRPEPGSRNLVGEATWWPSQAGTSMTIRAEVTDVAGNTTASQARLDAMAGLATAGPTAAGSDAGAPGRIQPLPPVSDTSTAPATAAGTPGVQPLPAVDGPEGGPRTSAPADFASPNLPSSRARDPSVAWPAQKMAEPLVQAEAATPPPAMPSSFPGSALPAEEIAKPQAAIPPTTPPTMRLSGRVAAPPEAVLPPPPTMVDVARPATMPQMKPMPPVEPPVEAPLETKPALASPADSPPSLAETKPPPAAQNLPKAPAPAGPALGSQQKALDGQKAPDNRQALLPAGIRPRMVNSRRFELGYDVDSIGSDGISKVELWGTRDGGRNWQCFGTDRDTRSPFPVTVDAEGVYGFRMIVETTGGLRGTTPRSGDLPEIWVGVDTSKPTARLVSARPQPASKTTEVVMRWEAEDQLLAARPITLLFSQSPTGPWTVLASGLENSGEYRWRIDARIPDSIYIRLEVRDEAGNLRAVETSQPVSIDRIRPQGRILDVRPIGEARQRPATLR